MLLHLAVQVVGNVLPVPRIVGEALGMHPVAVVMVIAIPSQNFGFRCVVPGPPLTAMIRDPSVYSAR